MMYRGIAVREVRVTLPGEKSEREAKHADYSQEEDEKAAVRHCAGGSHGGLCGVGSYAQSVWTETWILVLMAVSFGVASSSPCCQYQVRRCKAL